MTLHGPIVDVIGSNLNITAPVAAFLVAWLLYGVLGKRFLGADDDFWPHVRGFLLPRLDALGRSAGLYAEGSVGPSEKVGIVPMDLDAVELDLETIGYHRNPLASYKTNPQGWKSDGSWARRYGYIRGTGDVLRRFEKSASWVPVDPRFLAGMVGRFLQGLGDILATRQVHLTLFVEDRGPNEQVVHVYAHEEANSLNPLTSLAHYTAHGFHQRKGVRMATDDLEDAGIPVRTPAT